VPRTTGCKMAIEDMTGSKARVPLYVPERREFTPEAVDALRQIFTLFDSDMDALLNRYDCCARRVMRVPARWHHARVWPWLQSGAEQVPASHRWLRPWRRGAYALSRSLSLRARPVEWWPCAFPCPPQEYRFLISHFDNKNGLLTSDGFVAAYKYIFEARECNQAKVCCSACGERGRRWAGFMLCRALAPADVGGPQVAGLQRAARACQRSWLCHLGALREAGVYRAVHKLLDAHVVHGWMRL
jgi:hypothetical protein